MTDGGGDIASLERFAASSRCVFCGSSPGTLTVMAIEDLGGRQLVHIGCRECGHAVLAVVTGSRDGFFSVGLRTDCTSGDALRFRGFRPIAPDDVIAAHRTMGSAPAFLEALRGSA